MQKNLSCVPLKAQWSGLFLYVLLKKELNTSFPYWNSSGHKAALDYLYLGISEHQTVGKFLTANLHQEGWCPLYLPVFACSAGDEPWKCVCLATCYGAVEGSKELRTQVYMQNYYFITEC